MSKSINEGKPVKVEYKLVQVQTWEPFLEAREFQGQMKADQNALIITEQEGYRRGFMYGLAIEAQEGWRLVTADPKIGMIFARETEDEIKVPELAALFTADTKRL
jgi:hypothetical protein